jgi:hypothetical protein
MNDAVPGFIVVAFLIWNLYYGALIQTPYPHSLVTLYVYPLWRFLLVLFVLIASMISQEIGLMVALALFFYFMDMSHFIKPWYTNVVTYN